MDKAIWSTEYDSRQGKCFKAPVHEECGGYCKAIIKRGGKYVCFNCYKEVELDKDMKEFVDKMDEIKEKYMKCINCGGKKKMKITYRRNPVTFEWQAYSGKCEECGCKFIV